jgi:zinc/manganese transport system substrate-binding protein
MRSGGSRRGVGKGLMTALWSTLLTMALTLAVTLPAAAQDDAADRPSVVVTTEVLGAVVSDLVGDVAEVRVLMEGGANPHTFEPSARDAEGILHADLIVSNGLDLEEGLLAVLETAASEGVPWFQSADHLRLRDLEVETEAGHEAEDEEDQHGLEDPHIWTDPLAMRDVVVALEPALGEAGIDVGDASASLVAQLEALDAEVEQILSVVPDAERKLVTGHRSMGYFADRYGFELIGTVIPSLSTSGEPTARELASLIAAVKDNDVTVVFTEVGTPGSVARAVADDSGATTVALSAVKLPEDGSYASLIRDMATTIATALSA